MNHAAAARSTTSITELARAHGVSPAAIRHYERAGLLGPRHVVRAANGYRRFTPLAGERLRLIRLGRLAGFRLREMATRLAHWDDGTMGVEEKKRALASQLETVRERIAELRSVETFIEHEIGKPCAAADGVAADGVAADGAVRAAGAAA
jgi:DNA-binding transcriptional MerR regulator